VIQRACAINLAVADGSATINAMNVKRLDPVQDIHFHMLTLHHLRVSAILAALV
tara:strand:+ start:53 stop:214 length:162 start_codon:yes stop_codon:yes gene_type:complete